MSWHDRLDLLTAYGAYLSLAFASAIVLRLRYWHRVLATIRQFRVRWPRLAALVVTHARVLLAWPMLASLLAMALLLAGHLVLSRWLLLEATLTPAHLSSSPAWAASVALAAVPVAWLDLRRLGTRKQVPQLPTARLAVIEASLAAQGFIGAASHVVVGAWVRKKLLRNVLWIHVWVRPWGLRMLARTILGLLLWAAWAANR